MILLVITLFISSFCYLRLWTALASGVAEAPKQEGYFLLVLFDFTRGPFAHLDTNISKKSDSSLATDHLDTELRLISLLSLFAALVSKRSSDCMHTRIRKTTQIDDDDAQPQAQAPDKVSMKLFGFLAHTAMHGISEPASKAFSSFSTSPCHSVGGLSSAHTHSLPKRHSVIKDHSHPQCSLFRERLVLRPWAYQESRTLRLHGL